MLTCIIRYQIDPTKRAAFETYARRWGEAIHLCAAGLAVRPATAELAWRRATDGDDDVRLDLQTAFTTLYDLFSLDLALAYSRPLSPPLDAGEEQFVQERLGR